METPPNDSIQEIQWQATIPSVFVNFADEMRAASEAPDIIPQRSPKEFTKEATYMIYVMLCFTLLAVLGSSVTAYEFFFKDNVKKIKSRVIGFEKNSAKCVTRLERRKKSSKIYARLEDCKSFLKYFCIVKNGRKILSTASSEGQFDCIQGLRFVSNAFLILSHTGIFYICFLKDKTQAKPLLELRASLLLLNGNFYVDIFFVISGFLNAYLFFHKYSRCNGNISWFFFYFKRFVRLTPVYMIVLGFHTTLFTYTGGGAKWPTYDTNPICKKDWWWHLLYINNFEESAKECMVWCWYLAADMQFYIISPLFMISLMRWPRIGYLLIFACTAGSCAASFMLTYWFDLTDGFSRVGLNLADFPRFMDKYWKYFDIVYTKPYTRISTYLVGLTLGYCLFKKNIKKNITRNSKVTLYSGWIATASFMWISFFCIHKREGDRGMDIAFYNGTKSLLFPCGVAWIIYVCLTGQADFLKSCLSWKAFLPLGRLTYCAYLIHPILLLRRMHQAQNAIDFSVMSMISLCLYIYVFTYPVSFITSILFEMPVLNILDWLSKKTEGKTSSLTDSIRGSNSQNISDIKKIS